ncbi:hypothetical protein LCGC14_1083400 [marine sediment metagenome]|uniref:Uncharacterized protein n=1 Tax=marine sediment metagenome TaxID=412755 RepID=A0A0F9N288_9ZZZZ
MRNRRVKWLAAAGLGLVLAGYVVGRQHQSATVATCLALAGSLDQMVRIYEEANTEMWRALGAVARVEEQRAGAALPAAADLQ